MAFLQTFWWFLVLIGVMILLHELGHYLVGRFFDVKIDAFSIGRRRIEQERAVAFRRFALETEQRARFFSS